jgi:aryl sulfotransferase
MSGAPVRYASVDDDSSRWVGFPFRPGDIVISTRSKSGTTWMQMICALLIFQTPDLPAPLAQLSPWLDWLIIPKDETYGLLSAQEHRRFIKTHTPLDGVPMDGRVSYVVVARHPLDIAVSMYHQAMNLDHAKIRRLAGHAPADGPSRTRAPVHEWLVSWIDRGTSPREQLDDLPGVMWHLSDAWSRRGQGNVVLVHFQDLVDDLEGEMRHLAAMLGITVPEQRWPALVEAATFDRMRDRADRLAPDPSGVLLDRNAFFRSGSSGAGAELLSADELVRYHARAAQLAPPDLLAWLHRDRPPA